MFIFRFLLAGVVIFLYVYLFKRAAGSLKFSRLNMISLPLYYVLLMNLVGGSLIYIGFREHYLIQKVLGSHVIDKTYYIIAYTVLMLPATMIATSKYLSRKNPVQKFEEFIARPVVFRKDMTGAQAGALFMMMLCLTATAYVFAKLGYIPILRIATSSNHAIAVMRGAKFSGNGYLKNILMIGCTPLVSYYAYIYMKVTGSRMWRNIWLMMCVLSICVVTYNFEKAPSINYMLGYYLINITLGTVNDDRQFRIFLCVAVLMILFFYVVMQQTGVLSIYGGPVGRILFTQVATLFLHVDAFPAKHPYLNGASFYRWFKFIIPNASFRRSGRVVMEIYNPRGVQEGLAGVMNTMFVGEAYANFGMWGVIAAPIVFGVVIASAHHFMLNLKKRPEVLLLYLEFTMSYTNAIEGGFIDIFYSASYVIIPLVIIMLRIAANSHYSVSDEVKYMRLRER